MTKWPLINLVQVWKFISALGGSSELYKRDNFSPSKVSRCAQSIALHPATSEQAIAKRCSDDKPTAIAVDVTYVKSDMSTDRDCWHHSIAI